jgi:uncharacterized protein
MAQMVFVNLPVADLDRSKRFFESLGYSFNPQFTDDTTGCLVISDTIFAMLLTRERFAEFTDHVVAEDGTTEVLVSLAVESRAEVDRLVDAAIDAGAVPARDPMDLGFMYQRSFLDLDDHHWEILWMDPANLQ